MYPDTDSRGVRDPLRDKQCDMPVGLCARCGAELYWYDGEICPDCKEELESE